MKKFKMNTLKRAAKIAANLEGRIVTIVGSDKFIIETRLGKLIKLYMKSHRVEGYDYIYANYGKVGDSYHIARCAQDYPHDVCTDLDNLEHGWDVVRIVWSAEDEAHYQKYPKRTPRPWLGEGTWRSERGPIHITHTSKKPRAEVLNRLLKEEQKRKSNRKFYADFAAKNRCRTCHTSTAL